MKALSLWQPWASAIALGLKRHETRGQTTHYRGEIAVCATRAWSARGDVVAALVRELDRARVDTDVVTTLARSNELPHRCCVAIATLADALQVVDPQELRRQGVALPGFQVTRENEHLRHVLCWSWDRSRPEWLELSPADFLLGDYRLDRWVYVLRDVRMLAVPVAVRGAQRVFELDAGTSARIAQAEKIEVLPCG